MDAITTAMTTLQASLTTLIIPVSVVGLILWFIAGALQPVLPDWAQQMRGYFQALMIRLAIVGGAVTIVTAFYGMLAG